MITSFFSPKPSKKSRPKRNLTATTEEDTNRSATCQDDKPDESDSKKRSKIGNELSSNTATKRPSSVNKEVEELLSNLNDDRDDGTDAKTWRTALKRHFQSTRFASLAKLIASERLTKTVYPAPHDTFTALNLTPLALTKIVIVGQDPYHGPNQAHGLSFSVLRPVRPPPSLKNIYKELANDPKIDFTLPAHGDLSNWAKQGVLLLNSVCTVRKGEPNSHAKKGWEDFTDEVIRCLDRHHDHLVFLLWGNPASKKALSAIDKRKHTVICTSHPSPLGAYKTASPFLGSRCFSRVNEALREKGVEEVDWNLDV